MMPTTPAIEKKRLVPLDGRLRVFSTSPRKHFAEGFREIYETRMKSLPIVNKRLSVYATEFRRWGEDWIGAVATPWSMMIILACGNRNAWPSKKAGDLVEVELPAGEYEFLSALDPVLGEYRMLSLMSPVDRIEDQAAAEAFADAAIKAILTVPEEDRAELEAEEEGTPLPPLKAPSGNGKVIPIKAEGAKSAPGVAAPDVPEKPVNRRDFFTRYTKKLTDA